jgi:hypothetical protein
MSEQLRGIATVAIVVATIWAAVTLWIAAQHEPRPPRFSLVADAQSGVVHRLDLRTGEVVTCANLVCAATNASTINKPTI